MTRYTHKVGEKTYKLYGCAKRGCDAVNPDYWAFGSRNGKSWCLHHIPLGSRLRLWLQDHRRAS